MEAGKRLGLFGLAALALVFLVYGRSLPGGFVYDDHYFVERNPALRTLSGAWRFFSDPGTLSASEGLNRDGYRPVAALSFALDHALAGPRPPFSRGVNLFLHGVNVLLVFLLGRLLGFAVPHAALMGAFFALFPTNVESFVWISGRSNVLATGFILGAMTAFIAYAKGGRPLLLGASVLCTAAGLFTREAAVVVPLLALSYALVHRLPPRRWAGAVGFGLGVPAALFLGLRWMLLGQLQQVPHPEMPLWRLAALPFLIFAKYLEILVWPFDMQVTYSGIIDPRLASLGLYLPFAAAAAVLFAGLIAALLARGERDGAWGLLWAAISFLPVLNVVPMTFYMAERLVYLPLVGWSLAVAALVRAAGDRGRQGALYAVLGALFCAFIVENQSRMSVWSDDVSLWSYDVRENPRDLLSRLRLAEAQRRGGDGQGALASLGAALDLSRTDAQRAAVLNEMGAILAGGGDPGGGRRLFEAALRSDPSNPLARANLARARGR